MCPSCIAKLRPPGKLPWLTRNVTSQAGQNVRPEHAGQDKTQPAAQLPDDKLVVRHFVQLPDGALERLDDDLGEDDIGMLKSRIAELEADLQMLKSGNFAGQGMSPIEQLLAAKKALDGETRTGLDGVALETVTIPMERYPEDRLKNISKLNQSIQNFVKQQYNAAHIKDLWKWYTHCRNNLSAAWEAVPSSAWKVLWEAFSRICPENPNRMAHIRRLLADMKLAGVQLDKPQSLLYIEALFLEGKIKGAISQWESDQTALAYDPSTARNYWELGVRMLANDDQPDRAQQATDILISGIGNTDYRVLIPIIRSWLKSHDPAAVQRAWATYVRLKFLLGSEMEMKDYDAVAGAFLAAQQTDLALAVFRDMMLSADPGLGDCDSVAVYKRTLRLNEDLRSFKLAPEELSWRSQEAFTALPRNKQNKYFYGSWIKKLIGDGEVDWAAQVAGLMYQRGILPDPRYMNGIIGAWLRSGAAANHRKAEDLAWKMIAARLEFVRSRDQFGLVSPLRPMRTTEKKAFDRPSSFSQITTSATIETFCILINFYQRRRRGDRVQEICAAIKAAKIKPNTSFLNDMILVGAMQNRKQWTWNAYIQLVSEDGVAPDHDTFTILWQMMKDHVEGKPRSDFPSPRVLFAETARWPQTGKLGTLSREAYELILECFVLADDQIGTSIALRAMQHLFGLYPTDETIANMVLQLAKTGHRKVVRQFPRRQERAADLKSRMSRITEAADAVKEQRMKALLARGIDLENMDDTTRSEEAITILSDLLRFAARSRIVHPLDGGMAEEPSETNSVQELEQQAAEEMGVPQCAPTVTGASIE